MLDDPDGLMIDTGFVKSLTTNGYREDRNPKMKVMVPSQPLTATLVVNTNLEQLANLGFSQRAVAKRGFIWDVPELVDVDPGLYRAMRTLYTDTSDDSVKARQAMAALAVHHARERHIHGVATAPDIFAERRAGQAVLDTDPLTSWAKAEYLTALDPDNAEREDPVTREEFVLVEDVRDEGENAELPNGKPHKEVRRAMEATRYLDPRLAKTWEQWAALGKSEKVGGVQRKYGIRKRKTPAGIMGGRPREGQHPSPKAIANVEALRAKLPPATDHETA